LLSLDLYYHGEKRKKDTRIEEGRPSFVPYHIYEGGLLGTLRRANKKAKELKTYFKSEGGGEATKENKISCDLNKQKGGRRERNGKGRRPEIFTAVEEKKEGGKSGGKSWWSIFDPG